MIWKNRSGAAENKIEFEYYPLFSYFREVKTMRGGCVMWNVLIISEHIAPAQAVGSIRWTKMAKFLSQTGKYRISVLTSEKDYDGNSLPANHCPRDPLLQSDMRYFDQYIAVPETRALRWSYGIKKKLKGEINAAPRMSGALGSARVPLRWMRRAFWTLSHLVLSHDWKDYLHWRAVKRYIDRYLELAEYDVIISTFGPGWPHWAASHIKRMNPAVVWIADYRDPYYSQLTPAILRRRHKRFAITKTGSADRIIAVSEEMLPLLHLSSHQRATVVPNGFDPSEAAPPKPPPRFSLVYTGTLYSMGTHFSDLSPAFAAVKALIDEGTIQEKDVLLQYAGNKGDLFLAQATACGLEKCTQDLGLLSRDAAMELQREAAILLMAIWNNQEEQGVVTGKIYEYMLSHKPILAVCNGDRPNSELKAMIERGALGFCYEEPTAEQDALALKEWLKEMYLSWKGRGSLAFSPNEEYVRQFGYDRLAARIDQIIEEGCGRRGS